MESSVADTTAPTCLYLGIKVCPGPVVRHRLENFPLDNTVSAVKKKAEIWTDVPSDSLEVIHRGKILNEDATLIGSGVRGGEMLHVVRRRPPPAPEPAPAITDAELHQIVTSLRAFGCTPSAPGWTRAMQVLNDEARTEEILEAVPALADDCVSLSMLHEIELLAALGATLHTMRRGAAALPALPAALRRLTAIVRAQPAAPHAHDAATPTSGFAYSLEALSEDEDGEEEDEEAGTRQTITTEQFAAALRMAREAASSDGSGGSAALLQALQGMEGDSTRAGGALSDAMLPPAPGGSRNIITSDMFSNAVTEALNRVNDVGFSASAGTPMDHSTAASSSQSPAPGAAEDYSSQLRHMHEVGLLDDTVNMRALLICAGDVNAAINFVFTSMEE